MRKPNARQRTAMGKLAWKWNGSISPIGEAYLTGRGIGPRAVENFLLGVVSTDAPSQYQDYVGRLAIPYVDRLGVYGFKFRCLAHTSCKEFSCHKYLNPSGQELSVFNVTALGDEDSDTLHICEGEFDCMTLWQYTQQPVIGFPGVDSWREWWHTHLMGFERVLVWQHPDMAGKKLGQKVRDVCRNAEIVPLPKPEDVNSLILSWGPDKVLALTELEEE